MFLQALYEYAQEHHLLENIPLRGRLIHALIPIDSNGLLRSDYLIPLTQSNAKGKEFPGQERLMPRFPLTDDNNGGKAYFLADNATAILGRSHKEDLKNGLDAGDPIWTDPKKGRNPTKSFLHFWQQVQEAYDRTNDLRLKALLVFKTTYLVEKGGRIHSSLPFLEMRTNKSGNKELVAVIGEKEFLPLKTYVLGFSVDGAPLTMEVADDPLREYWFDEYLQMIDEDDENTESSQLSLTDTVCLITGEIGKPIARSHNPKITGVPRFENKSLKSSNARLVSFNTEYPAFSSYGFVQGENAPVSVRAASSYALAINQLLKYEDTSLRIGTLAFCSWAKKLDNVAKQISRLLLRADPEQALKFLNSPFAGINNGDVESDRFYTIALSCPNKGRIAIEYWLNRPIAEAVDNFAIWWDQLDIVTFGRQEYKYPLSLQNLARSTLYLSKENFQDRRRVDYKLIKDRQLRIYRAALEGTSLPITMLKPILDEFHSALVKNDEKKPTYPYSRSRFALIKLILIRNNNRKEEFMPEYQLTDTNDASYNLGCLLAVLEALQKRSMRAGKTGPEHGADKPNAGIIERYYGQASTAPALVFPYLLSLSRHHLSKLSKGNEKDKRAAKAIEETMINICKKFKPNPEAPGEPPEFPRLLDLERQGRFALGFYQQKAYDIDQARKYKASQGKEGLDIVDIDESNEVDSGPVE
ncbi:MAG: type I-C CRISPR-associated protein Cas8c/Csd1 [Syntrophorhabdaceae bacterium]|nr:type I-C CRISPR-associated protein Cas8c/Csd1 [Syntrophorhabdaceae bacterium]